MTIYSFVVGPAVFYSQDMNWISPGNRYAYSCHAFDFLLSVVDGTRVTAPPGFHLRRVSEVEAARYVATGELPK